MITFATLLTVAGCPTGGDGGDDGGTDNGTDNGGNTAKAITGRWTGTVSSTLVATLNGTAVAPQTSNGNLTVEFDANGLPNSLTVISFGSGTDPVVTVRTSGETETVTVNAATYVVTVRSATYTSTSARVTLDIVYSTTSGNATTNATGVQTIEATVNGATLNYNADVAYDATLANASAGLSFDVDETTDCTGNLAKQ
jgi:hypothetical protein